MTPQQEKGLEKVATFLGKHLEKLNAISQEDFITSEVKKELLKIMAKENFTVDHFSGGNAIISIINYNCEIMGYETVISGEIKFVVEKYDDNPCDTIISEDGYFDGYCFVWNSVEEESIFNESLLITL